MEGTHTDGELVPPVKLGNGIYLFERKRVQEIGQRQPDVGVIAKLESYMHAYEVCRLSCFSAGWMAVSSGLKFALYLLSDTRS